MLALRQTLSQRDSVVHLHNVPAVPAPPSSSKGRHAGYIDKTANAELLNASGKVQTETHAGRSLATSVLM